MIIIDGVTYNVPVLGMKRKAEFLDKSAKRTEDGKLHRELIGVFFNYEIRFGRTSDLDEYAALYVKLTEVVEFHSVTMPTHGSPVTFQAYFAGIGDEVIFTDATQEETFWKDLTVNFIAKDPA